MLLNNPKILDNSDPPFQLKTCLVDLLTSGKYTELSIATGYWDLPGMLELLPALETFLCINMLSEIRFLIGEEPKVRVNQLDASFPGQYDRYGLADLIDAFEAIDTETPHVWIGPLVGRYIDALIDGPRRSSDLRPLCRLVEKKPHLFNKLTLSRVTVAVENVAESILENDGNLDAESLREEAETLESLSKVANASVADAVAALREMADERDDESLEDDDDRIEYSSSSSREEPTATDEDIESMFSTLTVQT